MAMEDTVNAFVSIFTVEGARNGPLTGLSFGAKDLYDVAGHVTGCGNPDWVRTHGPAEHTAPAVQALLDAGATLLGKTHTDELAYSLMGVNAHYGTPANSKAPDRVPGGSSSGSVAATAAGLVDIGLGSDTGGSVRMPASFCGVFGIRTTHGRIDLSDAMPFAPSFDTAGWFARDAETFALAGLAYDITAEDNARPRLLLPVDALALASPETRAELDRAIRRVEAVYGPATRINLAEVPLGDWREVFRICQAGEVWQTLGAWITETGPDFGPGIKERFEMAAGIPPEMLTTAQERRGPIRDRLRDLLGEDGILLIPTSPGPAPKRDADEAGLNDFRTAALELLCPAGLAGLPQISIPTGTVDGGPVGLSMVAGAGLDGMLLAMAKACFGNSKGIS